MRANGARKNPVSQDTGVMSHFVFTTDNHRAVEPNAQFASIMAKRFGQSRNIRWPALGLLDQGSDKTIAVEIRHFPIDSMANKESALMTCATS
jgi:hypothetical protein